MMKINESSVHAIPSLIGKAIYLRPAVNTDFEAMKSYRQDPENCRYIRAPEGDEQIREILEKLMQPWTFAEGHWNGLVICQKNDDAMVGEIVFRMEDWQNQRAEIGYRLHQAYGGKGYATQAGKLLVDYLFDHLGFYKVVAKCDPRNIASYRVMEKLGFVREASFKNHYRIGDEWTDQLDYGLLHFDRHLLTSTES